jgi:hypothetical protein
MTSGAIPLPGATPFTEVKMIWIRTICTACLCLVLLGCSENGSVTTPDSGPDSPPPTYPTTLKSLTEDERQGILSAFMERNPGVCLSLDQFGLPSRTGWCPGPSGPSVSDREEAEAIAFAFLGRNRDVFHIEPSYELTVQRSRHGGNDRWGVYLEGQTCRGLEVLFSEISVYVVQSVFLARGSHYPEAYVPETSLISADAAFDKLPSRVPFECWGGMIYLDVENEPKKVILPLPRNDPIKGLRLELRVAWQFPLTVLGSQAGVIHVDTMTGEWLNTMVYILC